MSRIQENTLNFFGELQNNPFKSTKEIPIEDFKLKLGFLVGKLVGKTNFDTNAFQLSSAHTNFFKKLNDLNLSFNYELAGIHLISSRIDNGRISQILSADNYSYHAELLQLYYDIYGRINTLNERFIEVFKRKLKSEVTTFKFNFTGSNDICYEKDKRNSTIWLNIPNSLRKILFPKSLFPDFYECPKEDINWFSYARLQGIIELLNGCIEKGYYHVIRKYEFQEIKEILKLIDLQKDDYEWNSIIDYNSSSNNTLIELLKIFQGAFIYQKFASKSICTTLIKDNENILGITIGGNVANSDNFIKVIRNNHKEVLKIVDKEIYNKDEGLGNLKFKNLKFHYISKVKEIYKINKDTKKILELSSKISEELRELKNQIHEGHPLRYIIYIADQSIFSKFKIDYSFNTTELKAIKTKDYSKLKPIFDSHYSIFQSGFTGLFIDFNNPYQEINIVRPSNMFANKALKQTFFEVLENTANAKPSDIFISATKLYKDKLAIIDFGKGRVSIYMNGLNILNFPDKYENKWWSPSDSITSWSKKENIVKLLKDLFSKSGKPEIVKSSVKILADSILNISETPGEGSMLVFIKNDGGKSEIMLEGYRNTLNAIKLGIWKDKSIFDFTADEFTQLLIPDGACVVNLENLKIENQLQIIPIKDCKAIDTGKKMKGGSKGTRYNTAMAITKAIEGSYSICISADGPISVFRNGKQINNI